MHPLTTLGWTLVLLTGAFVMAGPEAGDPTLDAAGTNNPHPPGESHTFEWDVTAFECDTYGDGICLGYDGQRPGPTIVVNDDDWVNITLTNRILETLPEGHEATGPLADARISLHTHGVYVSADKDGISSIDGTHLVDSAIDPGETFTYSYQAPYAGAWHYHDHVMGVEGHEGSHRGLHGTLYVLEKGETTDHVFDLHLLHTGPNGGEGLNETVEAGDRFDIAATALGDFSWTVTLTDPDGEVVQAVEMGPGSARALIVRDAQPGTYTWTGTSTHPFLEGDFEGTVEVQAP